MSFLATAPPNFALPPSMFSRVEANLVAAGCPEEVSESMHGEIVMSDFRRLAFATAAYDATRITSQFRVCTGMMHDGMNDGLRLELAELAAESNGLPLTPAAVEDRVARFTRRTEQNLARMRTTFERVTRSIMDTFDRNLATTAPFLAPGGTLVGPEHAAATVLIAAEDPQRRRQTSSSAAAAANAGKLIKKKKKATVIAPLRGPAEVIPSTAGQTPEEAAAARAERAARRSW